MRSIGIGCLLLLLVASIMTAWAIGTVVLFRRGYYLLGIASALTWPLGLNIVLGTTVWIGSKLTSEGRR
jgi:hypothetical protein